MIIIMMIVVIMNILIPLLKKNEDTASLQPPNLKPFLPPARTCRAPGLAAA